MSLLLIGISHRVAPVELRERVALGIDEAAALARELAADACEAVCLSTCNRTELYLAGGETLPDAAARAVTALAQHAGLEEPDLRAVLYRLEDEAAGIHLFRVAAGLDSMVPGEGEILGQVRDAFEAGTTGPLLDRLFSQAIHAGKKVRMPPRSPSRSSEISAAAGYCSSAPGRSASSQRATSSPAALRSQRLRTALRTRPWSSRIGSAPER
jgi:glutamyl-tRNA reductase